MDLTQLDPKKRALSLFDEFKAFAFKGNVIDLAVGVIVGTAFARIVSSLVENLIMPAIGVIMPGKYGYEGWTLVVAGKVIPYGKFLGDVVNFVLVAAALFIFTVKFLGWIIRVKKEAPPLTKQEELLTEIRDLLRRQAGAGGGDGPGSGIAGAPGGAPSP